MPIRLGRERHGAGDLGQACWRAGKGVVTGWQQVS